MMLTRPSPTAASRVRTLTYAALGALGLTAAALTSPASAQDTTPKTGEAWQIIPLAQSTLVYARDSSLIGESNGEE